MEDRLAQIEKKAKLALSNVLIAMPYLAGLVAQVRLHIDERVETAGIFASGRLLVNPQWLDKLSMPEATFVMAHELMHLVLQTHERAPGSNPKLVNIAHDIVINQILEHKLEMYTPAGGLRYYQLIDQSSLYRFNEPGAVPMEEVMALIQANNSEKKLAALPCWGIVPGKKAQAEAPPLSDLGETLALVFGKPASQPSTPPPTPQLLKGDVFSVEDEQRLFPHETARQLTKSAEEIQRRAINALSAEQAQNAMNQLLDDPYGRGYSPGDGMLTLEALKSHYNPPWQWALQQWMEATAPAGNSYARPSRRGQYAEFVRPGKTRRGETIHVVLDTSGSMSYDLRQILGVMASFCEITGVDAVHVLQCDTEVTADEWVPAAELSNFNIFGFGGSDMSPAMYQLAADPEVERAIVITDGEIGYPGHPMPYEVLWVLTSQDSRYKRDFNPGYGQVIGLTA